MEKSRQVLMQLLDANRHFAVGAKGTSNHCPMALVALARMGGSPQVLQDFFERWKSQYALPAPAINAPILRDAWRAQLGKTERFEALQLCLHAWLQEAGVNTVLHEVLSQISFAPASGAFHALIRLAYALEAKHTGEIAAGLAFLITRHLQIDVCLEGRVPADTARQALTRLSMIFAGTVFHGDSIVSRLRALAADPRFAAALPAVPATQEILDEMAALAISAYWQTSDFTVLHMVTGMHAARLLFALLPEVLVQRLLPQLWIAFAAAYVVSGAPHLQSFTAMQAQLSPALQAQQWQKLMARAIANENEHVIKLSYSCHQENLRYSNPLYLASVARLLA